jgi:hypothetical protein
MKKVDKLIAHYKVIHAKRFLNKKVDDLTEVEFAEVKKIAVMSAYIDGVIPDGFGEYTIFDFNGQAINRKDNSKTSTISKKVALRAKNAICKYCWGLTWKEISKKRKENPKAAKKYLRENSVMMQRYENRNNIVIYGESKRPIGRTMLASIVMKEAFRLRSTHNTIGHSYDWVDFSKLFRTIESNEMSKNRNKEHEDTDDLIDYKTCNWLVVDNIQKKLRSEKQTTFYSDLLDSFFLSRYESDQPIILVFKFDIRDKHFDFERAYGTGLSKIIESDRTFKIPLSENLLNNNYYE